MPDRTQVSYSKGGEVGTIKKVISVNIPGFHPIQAWLLKRRLKKWFGKPTPGEIHNMFRAFAKKEGYTLTIENGVEVYSNGKTTLRIDSN